MLLLFESGMVRLDVRQVVCVSIDCNLKGLNMENYNLPTIKTERLILRKFTENDIEHLFSI